MVSQRLTCDQLLSCRPAVVRDTLLGAISTKLMQPTDQVVSLYHRRLEHGYPTPTLGRDAVLNQALPWLQQHGIYSRGRFGSYKVSTWRFCSTKVTQQIGTQMAALTCTSEGQLFLQCLSPSGSVMLLLWPTEGPLRLVTAVSWMSVCCMICSTRLATRTTA